MKRRIALPLISALIVSAGVGSAFGDGHSDKAIESAIKARKAQMTLISYNMGILGDMAKGQTEFDSATATAAATSLSSVAKLDRDLFWLEGSIQGTVPDTRAKETIWSDPAGFEDAAQGLESAADALIAAAGTDLVALQGAMGTAGKSCGTCHETYRGPRN